MSVYDAYKGVIVFCRIREGSVKPGTTIRMMATGAEADVVEVGYFGAGQFIPCDELEAGMVGYITASLKNVKETRVGDTITEAKRPCDAPLPGYKKVNPMVYCGLYPTDGAKYPDLRDALEKLQLNDAALQFEPETSIALGFGFRCGFLGLLHLEVIQERLEREFNLDLVTTAPGVVYRVHKTDGTMIELTNPSNLPDPSEIEYMEEPMVAAEIMVTSEYVGAIMDLCQERRGIYKSMEYIGKSGDASKAEEVGRQIGMYLKKLGFNLDFAPVADINTNPQNIVIGDRSYGSDPSLVAEMVSAQLDGMHDSGITGTLKHFPGHGDTKDDTHSGYVSIEKTWDELKVCELIPFTASLPKTDMVMVSHITAVNVTNDNLPSSMSEMMITEKLRNELGYDGVVITDAMAMGAVADNYTSAEAAVTAVKAGVDIVLMPQNLDEAFNGVMNAITDGEISMARLDESVLRILKMKAKYKLI